MSEDATPAPDSPAPTPLDRLAATEYEALRELTHRLKRRRASGSGIGCIRCYSR